MKNIGIVIGIVLAIGLALIAIQTGLFASLYKIILKDTSKGYSAENVQSTVLHGAAMGEKFMIEENGNTGEWVFVYPSSSTQTSSVVFTLSEISMLISGEEIVKSILGAQYIFFIDSFPVQGISPYPKVLFASFGGNIYAITANTPNKSLDTFISNFLSRQANRNTTNNNEGIFGAFGGFGNSTTTSTNTGNNSISGAIGGNNNTNSNNNNNQNRNNGNNGTGNTMFPNFGNDSLARFASSNNNNNNNNSNNGSNPEGFFGSPSPSPRINFAISGTIAGNAANTGNSGESFNPSESTRFFTARTTNNSNNNNNSGNNQETAESYDTNKPANGSDTSLYLTPEQCRQLSASAQAILCAGGAGNGGQNTGDYLTNNTLTDEQKKYLEDWAKIISDLGGGGSGLGTVNNPLTINSSNPKSFIHSFTGAGDGWVLYSTTQDKDYFYYVVSPCNKDAQTSSNPFAGQSCSEAAKIVIRIPKTAENNNISNVYTRTNNGVTTSSCAQNGGYAAPAAFDEWADGYHGNDPMGDYRKYVENFACNYCGVCSSAQTLKNTNGECGATAGACTAGTASSVTTGPNNYVWTCGLKTCKIPKSGATWTRTKAGGCVNGLQKYDVSCKDSTGAASTACTGTKPADSEACNSVAGTCGASLGACTTGTSSGLTEGPNNFVWSCGSTVCKTPKSGSGWTRTKSGGCVNGVQKFDVVCKDSTGAASTACSGTKPADSESCATPKPSSTPSPSPSPSAENKKKNNKPQDEMYRPTPTPNPSSENKKKGDQNQASKPTPLPPTPKPTPEAPKPTPLPPTPKPTPEAPKPTPEPRTPTPTPYIPPVDEGSAR